MTRAAVPALVLTLLSSGCTSNAMPVERFLRDAWPTYRLRYLSEEGYVLDPRRDGGSVTSEGQGYALLRAVWERDADTFARVFAWTEATMKRPDGLYSWLWTPQGGGRIIDTNTATDGDQEIAYALAMACVVFDEPAYGARAAEIVRAVREHTGIEVGEHWFPSAGNWARHGRVVNLSYFVPYAHPWFDRLDPEGDWERVAGVGYELVARVLEPTDRVLVPDFISLDASDTPVPPVSDVPLSEAFSFDAVRLFWRLEADCELTGRPEACADVLGLTDLAETFERTGLVTRYRPDGDPVSDEASWSFGGALVGAARRHAPDFATFLEESWSEEGLLVLLEAPDRYYDHNWVWFGLALDSGMIRARTPDPQRCPMP